MNIKISNKIINTIIFIGICLMTPSAFGKTQQQGFIVEHKQLLLDKLILTEMVADSMGMTELFSKLPELRLMIQNMTGEDIDVYSHFQEFLQLRESMDNMLEIAETNKTSSVENNAVVIDDDPSPLDECVNVDPGDVELALANKLLSAEIISAAKWACLETVFGENAAATCTVFQIIAKVDAGLFATGEYCLKNRSKAENSAMYNTIKSIGEELNTFVDDTLSSRATESSVQNVQNSVDTANSEMDDYFPVLDSNLNTALLNLDFANDQLNNIHSQADSLLFRVQVDQIEIETIEIATSDIQQRAEEIRDDTQTLLLDVQSTLDLLSGMNHQSDLLVSDIIQEQIEFVLARPINSAPLSFQIPATQGGQLEQVREVLINQLNSVAELGGDVSNVQNALATGDLDYNSGQYKSAYNNYTNAYQLLLGVSF